MDPPVHVRAQVLVHMWLASGNEKSICALIVHGDASNVLIRASTHALFHVMASSYELFLANATPKHSTTVRHSDFVHQLGFQV